MCCCLPEIAVWNIKYMWRVFLSFAIHIIEIHHRTNEKNANTHNKCISSMKSCQKSIFFCFSSSYSSNAFPFVPNGFFKKPKMMINTTAPTTVSDLFLSIFFFVNATGQAGEEKKNKATTLMPGLISEREETHSRMLCWFAVGLSEVFGRIAFEWHNHLKSLCIKRTENIEIMT